MQTKHDEIQDLINYNQNEINQISNQIYSLESQLSSSSNQQLSDALILEISNLNAAKANFIEKNRNLNSIIEQMDN